METIIQFFSNPENSDTAFGIFFFVPLFLGFIIPLIILWSTEKTVFLALFTIFIVLVLEGFMIYFGFSTEVKYGIFTILAFLLGMFIYVLVPVLVDGRR